MTLSRQDLLNQWRAAGLSEVEEVDAATAALPPELQTGEAVARELVRRKLLTHFQAQQLLAGRGSSLILGNYILTDKLGQGGMGMVLKAEHRRMKRVVALKVLSPTVVKTPELLQRFQREVEAAARLTHKNIVAAFDADEASGIHYLVMEFVPGLDLSSYVKQHGPLTLPQALGIIRQAALGLEYAHQHGVIHRDIKPANLLLSTDGAIKILDMGLARLLTSGNDEGGQADLTNTGAVMGTVDYMSPEQALNTKHADERADIYSLGCTLYYLLTGRAVYSGGTLMEKILAHREAPLPSLSHSLAKPGSMTPAMSEALDVVFHRMVAKRPEDRFASMGAVLTALQAVTVGAPVVIGPAELRPLGPAGMSSMPASDTRMADAAIVTAPSFNLPTAMERSIALQLRQRTTQRIDRRWWWIGGGLAVVALLVAAVAPWLGNGKKASDSPSNNSPLAKKTQTESVLDPALQDPALAQWPAGPVDRHWNGIITHPTKLPGVNRWQVETITPRGQSTRLLWSPDQTCFAVFSEDQRMRIYRHTDDRLELEALLPVEDAAPIEHLFWSPDSQWLAWKTHYGEWVRTWDRRARRWGPKLESAHSAGVGGWSPDGKMFATAASDAGGHGVFLYEWPSGTLVRALRGHEGVPHGVSWSADGQRLAAAAWEQETKIWQLNGQLAATVNTMMRHLAWSPRGDRLAIIEPLADAQEVRVVVVSADGQEIFRRPTQIAHDPRTARWTPDGQFLLLSSPGGILELLQEDGQLVRPLGSWNISLACFRPQGSEVLMLHEGGGPVVDLQTGERVPGFPGPPHRCGDWSADGRWLASVNFFGAVTVWNADQRTIAATLPATLAQLEQVLWDRKGESLVTGAFPQIHISGETTLSRWNLSGERLWHQRHGNEQVLELHSVHDGRLLLMSSPAKLRLVDLETGTRELPVSVPVEPQMFFNAVAPAPQGDRFVLATNQHLTHKYRLSMGHLAGGPLQEIPQDDEYGVGAVAWNQQGDRFAVARFHIASGASSVQIWEPSRPSLVSTHVTVSGRIAFSPDGKTLLSTYPNFQGVAIRVGTEGAEPPHYPFAIGKHATPWSPEGSRFVGLLQLETAQGRLGILNPRTGLGDFDWPWLNGNNASWQPNGSRVAATRSDGVLGLWRVETENVTALWSALGLPDNQWASFSAGGHLLHSSEKADQFLRVILERDDGVIETIPLTEFGSRRSP